MGKETALGLVGAVISLFVSPLFVRLDVSCWLGNAVMHEDGNLLQRSAPALKSKLETSRKRSVMPLSQAPTRLAGRQRRWKLRPATIPEADAGITNFAETRRHHLPHFALRA